MIGLSPTCLRVATLAGGEVANVSCTPLEPGEWDQAWAKGLHLGSMRRYGLLSTAWAYVPGRRARVMYTGPKASAEVFNVPAEGPAALKASEFSLRETLGDKTAAWPVAVHVMHRDEAASRAASRGRSHVLAVGDSVAGSNMIAAWLMRAGLGVDGLIPAKAAAIVAAVRAATALPETGTHAVLWMGEHVTALAGWSAGRLVFARAIEFGFTLLADCVFRGARSQGHTSFGRLDAHRLLFAAGIPKPRRRHGCRRCRLRESMSSRSFSRSCSGTSSRRARRCGLGSPRANCPAQHCFSGAAPGAGIAGITGTFESQFDVAVRAASTRTAPANASARSRRVNWPTSSTLTRQTSRSCPPPNRTGASPQASTRRCG